VKPQAGDLLTMEMSFDDKVELLKQQIQEQEGTPVDRMRLTLDGVQLMDSYVLEHYGVHKGCTIQMQQRFELLQQALRNRAEAKVTLQLLMLRPQAAKEDDMNGVLPLQLAIQNGVEDTVVKALLKENREAVKIPVQGGAIGEYPLHLALQKMYKPDVIEELLQGTEPSAWKANGAYAPERQVLTCSSKECEACRHHQHIESQCKLPLHIAITNGAGADETKAIITLLLKSRCPIAARDPITGYSALDACLAADVVSNDLFGQIWHEIIKVRPKIAEEAPPANGNGQRPLHVAVVHNANQAIIEHLCVQGRDTLEAYDVDGRLPIHLAVTHQAGFAVVRTLLSHNPRMINKPDGQGRTPLQLAVTHKAQPGVVFEITRTDRNTLNVRDSRGRTLIELAVTHDAPQWVVQELLEASPSDALNLNLLSGKWPNTKASSEALRYVFEARKRQMSQPISMRGKSSPMGNQMSLGNDARFSQPALTTGHSGGSLNSAPRMVAQPSGDRSKTPVPVRRDEVNEDEEPSIVGSVGSVMGRWFGW
jgi:ankyrin repeat protein